jgi:glucan phosphoethanolaminetransferase (alkaline phosphatase superfamily)
MCLSDNVTPVRCSTDMWNFATGAEGVDPLMVAESAKALVEAVVAKFLIVLVITLGLASFIMTTILFLPIVFNWRHARNLHFLCIVMAGASAFFLFVLILITKFGVLGTMVGVTTTSLKTVDAQKGVETEAFLWTAWALWFLTFWFVWWVRWWEILERRAVKKAAKEKAEADEKKKKAAEEEKKKQAAQKDKPMKAEEAVLQQYAIAQM